LNFNSHLFIYYKILILFFSRSFSQFFIIAFTHLQST